jgi:hypothetical protein
MLVQVYSSRYAEGINKRIIMEKKQVKKKQVGVWLKW